MKRLSSNLSIFFLLLFTCFRADAAKLEVSTALVFIGATNEATVSLTASDLPEVLTSLEGSLAWNKDVIQLLSADVVAIQGMSVNSGGDNGSLSFSFFDAAGLRLTGDQELIELTFLISDDSGGARARIDFGQSPETRMTTAGFANVDLEMLAGYIDIVPLAPVELAVFDADVKDNDVLLNWKTESEINFSGFEVQRSTDGSDFARITWQSGQGDEAQGASYSFLDDDVNANTRYYYRLKMWDLDGTNEYSDVVTVRITGKRPLVDVYPNPVYDVATVAFENFSQIPAPTVITVYDNVGRSLQQVHHETQIGTNNVAINAESLISGVYTITLQQGEYFATQKMIRYR